MNLRDRIKYILKETESEEQNDREKTLYKSLKSYVRGKIDSWDLRYSDNMINRIQHNSSRPGESEIIFEFNSDEEFFELLELSDDDSYFARVVSNDGWEFDDDYQIEQDFKEGYNIYGDLDSDNTELMVEILLLLTGKKVDIHKGPEDMTEYSRVLLTTFPHEMDDIITEYGYRKRDEMNTTANQAIKSEINEFLEKIGFKLVREFDFISTTPADLIMWYSRIGDKTLDFKELFKLIIENSDTRYLGGWMDSQYEFRDENNFDSSGFNSRVHRILDSILDEIQSEGGDFEEYRNMIEFATKNYTMDTWYNLPKDENYQFLIYGFNREDMKIKLKIRAGDSWQFKIIELSPKSFNNFLYQPELFGLSHLVRESLKEYFDPLHFLKKKFSKKDDREPAGGLESVNKYGDEFQKIVDIIFKKAIKEKPIKNLNGLKVTSVWPQPLSDSDGKPNAIRWNVKLIPIVPDWFNYHKNPEFINNAIQFEDVFRNYARNMGLDIPYVSVKGRANYVENPDELHNYVSFNLFVRNFETF